MKPAFPLLHKAVKNAKVNAQERKHKPWEVSHLPPGKHAAFIEYGGSLYLELDRSAIDKAKHDVKKLIDDLVAAMAEFGTNHPMLVTIAASAPAVIIKKLMTSPWVPLLRAQMQAAFPMAGSYVAAATIIIAIEIAIIIIRTIEVWQKDAHSVDGGVIILIVFPNFQVNSVVYPRGGFKDGLLAEK